MFGRVLGTCSAAVLAGGLLSILIVPAAARTGPSRARLTLPRLAARARLHAQQPRLAHRSARRAPFLSWSNDKALSTTTIVNTYTVTTTADTTPASCPATASEPCTLRQAIMQANTDGTL